MFPAPYRAPRRVLRWLKWRERRGLGFHCDLTAVYLELGGNPQERSVTQDRLWVLADWISTVREYSLRELWLLSEPDRSRCRGPTTATTSLRPSSPSTTDTGRHAERAFLLRAYRRERQAA